MEFIEPVFLVSGHGFGINTDIFETNIINLAVVVGVVVTVVGNALQETLDDRKKRILENICAANDKYKQLELKILEAKEKLNLAKEKAVDIRQQGNSLAKLEKKAAVKQGDEESNRLIETKDTTIRFEQQQVSQELAREIVVLALDKARLNLKKRVKSRNFQIWVNKEKIKKYKTLKQYFPNGY